MKTWIALRALLDSLESQTEYKNLDASSQRLLEWIAVRVQKEAPLHIQEIILKSEVASPATVHKLLAILEQESLISMSVDVSDSRRRIVQITTQASRLFSKLDKGLETWAKALSKDSASGGLGPQDNHAPDLAVVGGYPHINYNYKYGISLQVRGLSWTPGSCRPSGALG